MEFRARICYEYNKKSENGNYGIQIHVHEFAYVALKHNNIKLFDQPDERIHNCSTNEQ